MRASRAREARCGVSLAASRSCSFAAVSSEGPVGQSLAGLRLLVVDDEADAREVMRFMLERGGAQVRTADSAAQALDAIREARPDLLISDIGMPDEDGYALMESIRVNEPSGSHLPAIALSAHARPEDVEHALKSGFDVHVAKPIDSMHLLMTVTALLHPVAGGASELPAAVPPAKSEADDPGWFTIRRQG
jgi:CheY-like chemotaxis protein